jgi:hypothetical protein
VSIAEAVRSQHSEGEGEIMVGGGSEVEGGTHQWVPDVRGREESDGYRFGMSGWAVPVGPDWPTRSTSPFPFFSLLSFYSFLIF